MRILLMGQHFAPEEISGAKLATDLATDLAGRGHVVTVVTCAPNYPEGRVFKGYCNRLYHSEILNGVRVIRIWSYISTNRGFWHRILNYATFSMAAFLGAFASGKHDIVLSDSTPLPLGISALLVSRLRSIPWVLRVEDLFPDAAIALGWLRNRLAIRFFYAVEKLLYRHASTISLISDGFRRRLVSKRVPERKMVVFPVWADPAEIRPMPKENGFRISNGLEREFIVMYSGNLGYTSCLEDLIAAAEHLVGNPNIQFIIVGEGVKKQALRERVLHKSLVNVRFLPYQRRKDFPEMLAAADVHFVSLNQDMSETSLPSKTFSAMASGRPLLAVAPGESDLARLILDARCGIVITPGRPVALFQAILGLHGNEKWRQEMGRNGRIKLESDFSRHRIIGLYEITLQKACHAAR